MLPPNYDEITKNLQLPKTNLVLIWDGKFVDSVSELPNGVEFKQDALVVGELVHLDRPIHLLFVATKNFQFQLKIIVASGSQAEFIEEHISLASTDPGSNVQIAMTIEVKDSAGLIWHQFGDSIATYNNSVEIIQSASSQVTRNFLSKKSRNFYEQLNIKLNEENALVKINGINFASSHQKMTNQILIEHIKPSCASEVLAKSVVGGSGENNFDCRVIVYSGASQSKAQVTNKNLLLSDQAIANTSPELEIYNDDVICNHGATVGQVDQEAIFYLQSRGIPKSEAIKMLAVAFVEEVISLLPKYDRLMQLALNYE